MAAWHECFFTSKFASKVSAFPSRLRENNAKSNGLGQRNVIRPMRDVSW